MQNLLESLSSGISALSVTQGRSNSIESMSFFPQSSNFLG
jgi:hypothetical protein